MPLVMPRLLMPLSLRYTSVVSLFGLLSVLNTCRHYLASTKKTFLERHEKYGHLDLKIIAGREELRNVYHFLITEKEYGMKAFKWRKILKYKAFANCRYGKSEIKRGEMQGEVLLKKGHAAKPAGN